MNKEELLKIARDAGFLFNEDAGTQAARDLHNRRIEEFANAILERAAVECQESELYRGSVFASRIRSLKSSIDS